jgi:phage tail-like protein
VHKKFIMQLPTVLYFRIVFRGLDDPGEDDTHFQSINGLHIFLDNSAVDQTLQTANATVQYSPLILRRAAKSYHSSALNRWLFSWFNKREEKPLPEAVIELLDETHQPVMSWIVRNLVPRSWKLDELNAEKNEILMETIELDYKQLLLADF